MDLSCVFDKYKESTNFLKGRMYVKMFKDCNLVSSTSQVNDLDLIFAKYKSKSIGIQYEDFLKSLKDVAETLNLKESEIKKELKNLRGPIYKGTETVPVKFYDDKSLYTGVHLHGGPSVVDKPRLDRI